MSKLNFSTQYYPLVNSLQYWVSTNFYPFIKKMKQRSNTLHIYQISSNGSGLNISNNEGILPSLQDTIDQLECFKNKAGIYGLSITIDNESAFIYIGKSKELSNRVRQHLTGKNQDGTDIASTTHHHYKKICDLATKPNINLSFFVWTNKKLSNSSNLDYDLGILEALFIRLVAPD